MIDQLLTTTHVAGLQDAAARRRIPAGQRPRLRRRPLRAERY